jgi:LuxR family maltose regulon positive regulatory protein
LEVLRLLAAGLTNEQIARRLTIALGTAKTHVHNLSAKLGAQNRVQAVARARALNLL